MVHDIGTLLRGIDILQRRQLASRTELLDSYEARLAALVNEGRKAMYHVQAVLREELARMERGYGTYGKYGVTADYFKTLDANNPIDITVVASNPREMARLERGIEELKAPVDPSRLTQEKLRVMLEYARDNGQIWVTDDWLRDAGFRLGAVNDALIAAASAGSSNA